MQGTQVGGLLNLNVDKISENEGEWRQKSQQKLVAKAFIFYQKYNFEEQISNDQ